MTVLEQLPTLIMYLVAGTLVFIIVAYVLAAKRPATRGPVIGHYTFHMWGADTIEGLTSLETDLKSQETLLLIYWLAKHRNLPFSEEELDQFRREVWGKIHLYGVRKGFKKVLIATTSNIRDPAFAESPPSERRKFVFPYGWLDKIHVYGPCQTMIQVPGWKVYMMAPLDLENRTYDTGLLESAKKLTKLLAALLVALPSLKEYRAAIEEEKKWQEKFGEQVKETSRVTHELSIALRALSQTPLERAESPRIRESPTISERIKAAFNWPQIIIAVLAFIGGYSAAPTHFPNIDPLIAGATFALVAYGILELIKRK